MAVQTVVRKGREEKRGREKGKRERQGEHSIENDINPGVVQFQTVNQNIPGRFILHYTKQTGRLQTDMAWVGQQAGIGKIS